MGLKIIVVGDRNSSGGVVLTGSPLDTIKGKRIARLGDLVDCPARYPNKRAHGVNPIVEGDNTYLIEGIPVALHGYKSACGCTLIGSVESTQGPSNVVTMTNLSPLAWIDLKKSDKSLVSTFDSFKDENNGLSPNLERTSYVIAEKGLFSMYDIGGKLIDRVAFTSGRDGVVDPSVKNRGPIPPGIYILDPKNVTFNGPNTLLSGDWGAMRVPLVPGADTNTFGRSGFYVHGGFAAGSAGCIDLGTPNDLRVLGQLKKMNSSIEVRVR